MCNQPNFQRLIIDDCSPAPDTAEVLQNVACLEERIKVLRAEKNGGAGLARNIGIQKANHLIQQVPFFFIPCSKVFHVCGKTRSVDF